MKLIAPSSTHQNALPTPARVALVGPPDTAFFFTDEGHCVY